MRNYVIEFVNGLRQVDGLLRVLRLPPLTKLTTTICTNVIEILLNETFIIIPPPTTYTHTQFLLRYILHCMNVLYLMGCMQ
jgi:hypothetical protein